MIQISGNIKKAKINGKILENVAAYIPPIKYIFK